MTHRNPAAAEHDIATGMSCELSSPPSRVILLVNPNARRAGDGVEAAVEALENGGADVRIETFSGPDEVEADILRWGGESDCVAVAGGDGTLSRAGGVLARLDLPLGILPAGTANDLARTLGIPDDLSAAANIILDGRRRRIDLGTVNGHPFFNVASIGLSAELSNALSSELKRRWGRLGYALAGARVLAQARRFTARITNEEETVVVRTLQIAVGNGRHYGGGTVVEAAATIDDGALDLYSLELSDVWKLAMMLRTFQSGSHGMWNDVRTAKSAEFNITTSKPQPVNVDGDLITETPAHFRVHPKAVTVFAPPAAAGGP
jgi:diacylglycerol kinase (ATP)